MTFRGFGKVNCMVFDSDGITPVEGAALTLRSSGLFGGTFAGATAADGTFTFHDIPVGGFTVSGTSDLLGGLSQGTLAAHGEEAAIPVWLGDSGGVSGTVFMPGGTDPAASPSPKAARCCSTKSGICHRPVR